MSAKWYNIFNLAEFLAEDLVSRTLIVELESIGSQTFEIFRGSQVSVAYGGAFLPVSFLGRNPYTYTDGGYAIYKDEADDVWIGIEDQ